MKTIPTCALALALVALTTTPIFAVTVSIGPSKDTTIFQNNVNNSSGGSNGLFAGTNGTSSPRRALIAFDIAGSIPAGSTIQSVQLSMKLGQVAGAGIGTPFIDLVPLTRDWGEGIVQTTSGDSLNGLGQGDAAAAGDATWNAAKFSQTNWTTAGSDFANPSTPSATTQITGTTLGVAYTWDSTALAADVQGWLNSPSTNFGWLIKSQSEAGATTFRAFYSREADTTTLQPTLTITYAVPEPTTLALAGLGATVLVLLRKRRVG